ncbi:hypothetical protein QT990_07125 [Microcoleus sp. T3_B1]
MVQDVFNRRSLKNARFRGIATTNFTKPQALVICYLLSVELNSCGTGILPVHKNGARCFQQTIAQKSPLSSNGNTKFYQTLGFSYLLFLIG